MGDLPGHGKQNQRLCYPMLQSRAEYKAHCIDHVLNSTVYSGTNTVPLIYLVRPLPAEISWSFPPTLKIAALADDHHAWRNLVVTCSMDDDDI